MADVAAPMSLDAATKPTSTPKVRQRLRSRHHESMPPDWSHLSLRLQQLATPRIPPNKLRGQPEADCPRSPPAIDLEQRQKLLEQREQWLQQRAVPRRTRAPSPAHATKWRNDRKLSHSQLSALLDRFEPKEPLQPHALRRGKKMSLWRLMPRLRSLAQPRIVTYPKYYDEQLKPDKPRRSRQTPQSQVMLNMLASPKPQWEAVVPTTPKRCLTAEGKERLEKLAIPYRYTPPYGGPEPAKGIPKRVLSFRPGERLKQLSQHRVPPGTQQVPYYCENMADSKTSKLGQTSNTNLFFQRNYSMYEQPPTFNVKNNSHYVRKNHKAPLGISNASVGNVSESRNAFRIPSKTNRSRPRRYRVSERTNQLAIPRVQTFRYNVPAEQLSFVQAPFCPYVHVKSINQQYGSYAMMQQANQQQHQQQQAYQQQQQQQQQQQLMQQSYWQQMQQQNNLQPGQMPQNTQQFAVQPNGPPVMVHQENGQPWSSIFAHQPPTQPKVMVDQAVEVDLNNAPPSNGQPTVRPIGERVGVEILSKVPEIGLMLASELSPVPEQSFESVPEDSFESVPEHPFESVEQLIAT